MTKRAKRPAGPHLLLERPMTPAVKGIGQIAGMIEGNITPHVWYHRSEFMTPAGRPDHNLITAIADILYWYRPQAVHDEGNGGVFVGWARKFQRDMLQYNYQDRADVFGMTKRQMQDACTLAAKRGLIRIEYRTENFRGKLYHNIVYVEPVPEAIAATLSEPNFQHLEKAKGATRGRHKPNPGIDDLGEDEEPEVILAPLTYSGNLGATSLNFERLEFWSGRPTSLNFERLTSQNFESTLPKFRDTYHETSGEISFLRDFKRGGALHATGNARAHEEPAAPVAVLEAPERTTSKKAAPPTASVAMTADGPVVAGTPAGVTPEGLEVSDEDLEILFGGQDDNAPAVEQVPAGPAEDVRPPEIDDLQAVPEAELLERPQAVANGPAYKAIMALVGGSAKLELLLGEETRSGGYGRERWLRLTSAEVELVKTTAQAQARRVGADGKRIPFSTLSILGLDRLIGAPRLTGGREKAAPSAGSYGNTTTVIPSGEKLTSPPTDPLPFAPGSQWREQKSGAVLTLQELVTTKKGMAFLMSNGATMTGLDLKLRFEAVG